jgi:hypothetical protein
MQSLESTRHQLPEHVDIVSYVSTAFEPGENRNNRLRDGNVLDRLQDLQKFLGEDAYFVRDSDTEARAYEEFMQTSPLHRSVDAGVLAPASIYNQMLRERRLSADQNLLDVLEGQGVTPEDALMVGFTGDRIGFYDELKADGKITPHKAGWEMIAGYNAMFARASERKAMGGRAADCSVVEGWAELPDGDKVMLLLHLTRDNIEGDTALSYGPNKDRSYIQAVLDAGAKHYGIAIEDFHLAQLARIDQLDYRFGAGTAKVDGQEVALTAEQMMDHKFRGWFDQGLLHNVSNPDWKRGDAISPTDRWVAYYQTMTEHVIMNSGVPTENIDVAHAINPGDVNSGHASNEAANDPTRAEHRKRPDARDAYLVIARESK